jgi:hypothetical protein
MQSTQYFLKARNRRPSIDWLIRTHHVTPRPIVVDESPTWDASGEGKATRRVSNFTLSGTFSAQKISRSN